MSRGAIIIGFLLTMKSLAMSTSDYSGTSFDVSRFGNDKFHNPVSPKFSKCPWGGEEEKFCKDTNSRCDGTCCKCICDHQKSTFDRTTMACRINKEIRGECKTMFKNYYATSQIKVLDLKKKAEDKIYWKQETWNDKVENFNIDSILHYHDGSTVSKQYFTVKDRAIPEKSGDKWEVTIKWDGVSKTDGMMFIVNTSHTIIKNKGGKVSRKDCFVFKSSGTITVTFPSQPTTPLSTKRSTKVVTTTEQSTTTTTTSPTTTEQSTTTTTTSPTSTTTEQSTTTTTEATTASTTKPLTKNTMSSTSQSKPPVEPPVSPDVHSNPNLLSTVQTKEDIITSKHTTESVFTSTKYNPTLAARQDNGDEDNTVIVSLAVVGCLILLVAVILVVLWSKKRSGNAASNEKNGEKGVVISNRIAENAVVMSHLENIYAEADNSVNYPGTDNYVYDYAESNLENYYTSLDKSKMDDKPAYQSLTSTQANLYEHIPTYTTPVVPSENSAPSAEPFYHVVDGTDQEPGNYRETPGRSENENLQDVLDDETGQESRKVPGRTGVDNPERVYSTLEDEGAEYLTVLPERSDYEQPINPPVSFA